MLNSSQFQDLSNKIKDIVNSSPLADVDKNIHALIKGALTKMELVTREEFDVQVEVLRHAREQLDSLEVKLAALEEQMLKEQTKQK
ncbi:accessory factor UbiK family protein [Methylotenera versatilis]|uniref:accessory factor UbiK family protein n=1 Tax=Methylotenera versatilis TaxID=1055487 RepID=UPI0006481675|nr:accessory factor UbiK family protein [Methylotenera versatilis]